MPRRDRTEAYRINRDMRKLMKEGFKNPLTSAIVLDYYSREVTKEGFVREYEEVLDYIQKSRKFRDRAQLYTREMYEQNIRSLKETVGPSITYQGFKRTKREGLIHDLRYYIEEGYIDVPVFRIYHISTVDLANTFKWAYAMAYNKITKRMDSEAFYTYIEERINKYL